MKRAADDRGMQVFLGVDTHSEAHVGVALDQAGRRLGTLEIPNERAGYARLLEWVLGFGVLVAAGVEARAATGLDSRASSERKACACWRSTARIASTAAGTASTTPEMPRPQPGPSWQAPPPESPRVPTGLRSRCAPSESPGDLR